MNTVFFLYKHQCHELIYSIDKDKVVYSWFSFSKEKTKRKQNNYKVRDQIKSLCIFGPCTSIDHCKCRGSKWCSVYKPNAFSYRTHAWNCYLKEKLISSHPGRSRRFTSAINNWLCSDSFQFVAYLSNIVKSWTHIWRQVVSWNKIRWSRVPVGLQADCASVERY